MNHDFRFKKNKKQIKAFKKKFLAGQKKKGFDPYKYLGKIKIWEGAKTGMEYQNKLRNDW